MALSKFAFDMGGGSYNEGFTKDAERGQAESGRKTTLTLHTRSAFYITSAIVTFPQPRTGLKYSDLQAFFDAHDGPADAFLVKARHAYNRFVNDDQGVGDGAKKDFNLLYRHADDSVLTGPEADRTLRVYVNDVLQTHTTDFTVENNGTITALIRHIVAPGAVGVRTEYDFFNEVTFDIEQLAALMVTGSPSLAVQGSSRHPVAMSEVFPGKRFRVP